MVIVVDCGCCPLLCGLSIMGVVNLTVTIDMGSPDGPLVCHARHLVVVPLAWVIWLGMMGCSCRITHHHQVHVWWRSQGPSSPKSVSLSSEEQSQSMVLAEFKLSISWQVVRWLKWVGFEGGIGRWSATRLTVSWLSNGRDDGEWQRWQCGVLNHSSTTLRKCQVLKDHCATRSRTCY